MNKMNKMNTIVSIILATLLLFSGCASDREKRIGEIIDFKDELPASLTAYSDDPSIGSKEITDAETIKKIVEMYKNRSYVRSDTPAPWSNAAVELKYGDGTMLKLSVNAIKGKDGKTYVPSTWNDGLAALIEELIKGS